MHINFSCFALGLFELIYPLCCGYVLWGLLGRARPTTIKLRSEREMMRISAHPEAEKPEEQHHNAQHPHTQFFLALNWLLFELWGLEI
jgi:hypothetical protein